MSVLRNLEEKIAGLVEGTFGRVFRSEVRPVELARKLAKEMDSHRTVSLTRTYVPNEYVIWLSPDDRERYHGVEREVIDELVGYLLEHARREKLALISRPQIGFRTDDRLTLGEFGIQARTVKAVAGEAEQADHGHTAIYSASQLQAAPAAPRPRRTVHAALVVAGKRHAIASAGASVGRSGACDVVLEDANVSRRHAEIRQGSDGRWTIADLGSTNGVRVNGREISGTHPLEPGDHVVVGTVDARFEVD